MFDKQLKYFKEQDENNNKNQANMMKNQVNMVKALTKLIEVMNMAYVHSSSNPSS
jgi:hypothetical protein